MQSISREMWKWLCKAVYSTGIHIVHHHPISDFCTRANAAVRYCRIASTFACSDFTYLRCKVGAQTVHRILCAHLHTHAHTHTHTHTYTHTHTHTHTHAHTPRHLATRLLCHRSLAHKAHLKLLSECTLIYLFSTVADKWIDCKLKSHG